MEDDALVEYQAVVKELQNQPDELITVQQRILELRPDHLETLTGLTRNLILVGEFDHAERPAVRALKISGEPEQHELLMDLYAQSGNDAKLASATRNLAKLYRDRGDEDKSRELMQRLPTGIEAESAAPSSPGPAVDRSEPPEPAPGAEELLDDDPFLATHDDLDLSISGSDIGINTDMDMGSSLQEIEIHSPLDEPAAPEQNQQVALPTGDPEQLLAEASVYLRYGKEEQAIASLRGVIAQAPKHRAALEKLGEAYAEQGQSSQAVEVWLRAAEQIRADGDASALEILRDRIATLDPELAAQIEAIEAAPTDSSEDSAASSSAGDTDPTLTEEIGFELDLDLSLDPETDEVAESGSGPELDFDTLDGGATDKFEIELVDDSSELTDAAAGEASEARPVELDLSKIGRSPADEEEDEDDDDPEIEFEIDPEDLSDEDEQEALGLELANEDSSASESTPAPDSGPAAPGETPLDEEIEEAEFYIAQDMFGEAKAILSRILEVAPDHAGALVLMGEILAASGQQVAGSKSPSFPAAEALQADTAATLRLEDDEDDEDGDTLVGLPSVETSADDELESDIEVELEDYVEVSPEPSEPEALATPQAADEPVDAGESFDLREALADVLDEDSEVDPQDTSGVLSTVEDGFESIFSDFKTGVSATLEPGDYDTRYDLGIAYREMGLFDDAIGEFRICLDSPNRRFDSLYLMGLCTRDLSQWDEAVNHLEQALAMPGIPEERLAGVYFDLSIAQEGSGDRDRALDSIQRVLEIEADFVGAAKRLAALESGQSALPEVEEPAERYESFDDLLGADDDDDEVDDEALAETDPAEAYESFDDVITETEIEAEVEVVEAEVELVEAEPVDQAEKTDPGNSKKGRRRKISFV
jgi:tetratricopeptide (TPR) repeat protein